jgi:hypothetical protein
MIEFAKITEYRKNNRDNNVFRRNNDGDYRCSSAISKAMFRDAAPEMQDAAVINQSAAAPVGGVAAL